MRRRPPRAATALAVLLAAGALAAQSPPAPPLPAGADTTTAPRVLARVEPDTVTVGDRFRAALFVYLPPGTDVELRVPADPGGRVEVVGALRVHPPDAPGEPHVAAVTLVAWTPGPAGTLPAELRVRPAEGAHRTFAAALPLPHVASVLPADAAEVQPREARDVMDVPTAARPWWPAFVAALLLALAVGWLAWLLLRRRPGGAGALDARRQALAELDRARGSGLLERGAFDVFYEEMSGTLRKFLSETDPRWSADLTTGELLARMRRDGVSADEVAPLDEVLRAADLAKFARLAPSRERALDDWRRARAWVEAVRYAPPPPPASPAPDTAAAVAAP